MQGAVPRGAALRFLLGLSMTSHNPMREVDSHIIASDSSAFGLITPPYGLALLMASKFVGVRFSTSLRAALPIYVIFFATIAFTIFFPNVVLWLPKQVFPESVGCFRAPSGVGYICPG